MLKFFAFYVHVLVFISLVIFDYELDLICKFVSCLIIAFKKVIDF